MRLRAGRLEDADPGYDGGGADPVVARQRPIPDAIAEERRIVAARFGAPPVALAVVVLVALAAASCDRAPAESFALPPAGASPGESALANLEAEGFRFVAGGELGSATVGGERRAVLRTTPAGWTWSGRAPDEARLHLGVAVDAEVLAGAGFTLVVTRVDGERRDEIARQRVEAPASTETGDGEAARWLDLTVDLAEHGDGLLTIEAAVEIDRAESGGVSPPSSASSSALASLARPVSWAPLTLRGEDGGSGAERRERPNVLLIVIDTLRADHLGAYGYERATSPNIDALFAARGVVLERAYAQAPWTLPSAASYLTGREPGELYRSREAGVVIPADVSSLAERMRAVGYRTAAYVANPTLFAAAGFDRGFDTYWLPPAKIESLARPGDDVVERVTPWLRAYGEAEPYFLYLHFVDPHDPYASPDTGGSRSPFFEEYEGSLTGHDVHALYLGQRELRDPVADRAQLAALYDSEIAYVDRKVAEVMALLSDETLEHTLVILTADHGEELGERGGWKHGHTLFDEQVRVPLFFRWDGRVPAGRRLPQTVRLLDLVPTILSAAQAPAPSELPGLDLLPAISGEQELPERPALSQRLSFGPALAGVVAGGFKLVLFNEREPFTPADELQRVTSAVDARRLRRLQLFDLAADPAEMQDLSESRPDKVAELAPFVLAQLGRELPGLRVIAGGGADGRALRAAVVFERPPDGWWPELLGGEDRVELRGERLVVELRGERFEKSVRVLGETGDVVSIAVWLDGVPQESPRLVFGADQDWAGAAIDERDLAAERSPSRCRDAGTLLCLWRSSSPTSDRGEISPELDRETRDRLEALGYLGSARGQPDGSR